MHLRVVPEDAAGQVLGFDAGSKLETIIAGQRFPRREMFLPIMDTVSIPTHEIVDEECDPHRCTALHDAPSIRGNEKRKWMDEVRRDAHQVAPLSHRLPHTLEIRMLEVADAAVDRL